MREYRCGNFYIQHSSCSLSHQIGYPVSGKPTLVHHISTPSSFPPIFERRQKCLESKFCRIVICETISCFHSKPIHLAGRDEDAPEINPFLRETPEVQYFLQVGRTCLRTGILFETRSSSKGLGIQKKFWEKKVFSLLTGFEANKKILKLMLLLQVFARIYPFLCLSFLFFLSPLSHLQAKWHQARTPDPSLLQPGVTISRSSPTEKKKK